MRTKLIHVNFVSKQVTDSPIKPLTKIEMHYISLRIDAISEAMDLCDSDRDGDILDNLDAELCQIISQLNASMIANENQERIEKIQGKRRKGQRPRAVS